MSASSHLRIPPRRPRNPADLRTALNALTGPQKAAIWTDLTSGTPPKWATNTGRNAGALVVLHLMATSLTLLPADVAEAKLRAAVLWVLDHPAYLIRPPFAPTVNIPGTESFL